VTFFTTRNSLSLLALFTGLTWSMVPQAQLSVELVSKLNAYPHATTISESVAEVRDHEIGLGAIRKIRGAWQFKNSERRSGVLGRQTWQIIDGFDSAEVLLKLETELAASGGGELLFACDGRSCGQGVQWANRVFGERILYGREDLQRYRVYALGGSSQDRVILYSSARTADRQYLHLESLLVDPVTEP
jgi:hypothetical protein